MSGMKGLVAILSISATTCSSAHAKILRGPYESNGKKWCKADCKLFEKCKDYHYEDNKCTLYGVHKADEASNGPMGKEPFQISFRSPDERWCKADCEFFKECKDYHYEDRKCTMYCEITITSPDKAWCRKECEMAPGCNDYHFDNGDNKCTLTSKSPTSDGHDGPEDIRPFDISFMATDETWCRKECEMTPGCNDYHFNSGDKECTLSETGSASDGPDGPENGHDHQNDHGHGNQDGPCVSPVFSPDKIWCEKECEMTRGCTDYMFHKEEEECVLTCDGSSTPPPSPPPPVMPAPPRSPPSELKPCVIGETFMAKDKKWCLKACGLTPECYDVKYMDKECTCYATSPPGPTPHSRFELRHEAKVDTDKENVWKW